MDMFSLQISYIIQLSFIFFNSISFYTMVDYVFKKRILNTTYIKQLNHFMIECLSRFFFPKIYLSKSLKSTVFRSTKAREYVRHLFRRLLHCKVAQVPVQVAGGFDLSWCHCPSIRIPRNLEAFSLAPSPWKLFCRGAS